MYMNVCVRVCACVWVFSYFTPINFVNGLDKIILFFSFTLE